MCEKPYFVLAYPVAQQPVRSLPIEFFWCYTISLFTLTSFSSLYRLMLAPPCPDGDSVTLIPEDLQQF
jgi:hypothetical protein